MSDERREFDLAGALPWQSTTAIEASAGTGKTYALSGLVVRYVAERGVPIDEILLVTFTRAATAELRERVRSRLVDVLTRLEGLADDTALELGPGEDPVVVALSSAPEQRSEHLSRLRRAVLEFDAATISTIHGFCTHARTAMGVRFSGNPDAVPTEAGADVLASVCNDALVRAALDPAGVWLVDGHFSPDAFRTVVQQLRTLPDSRAATVIDDELHRRLVELVEDTSKEVDRRLATAGSLTYDVLVTSVRDELQANQVVVDQLRRRFQVALIDEFQDTDSAQWGIFSTVFGPPSDRTLVVVGDPKQSIYSFRGGDVHTYLEALGSAGVDVVRLAQNQRSDRSVVEAMNALGQGHTLGSERIVFEPVSSTPRLDGRYLSTTPDGSPATGLQVRFVTGSSVTADSFTAGVSEARVRSDLVDVTLGLLSAGVIHGAGRADPRVRPGDIAVLVGASREAAPIAEELRAAGVPVVLRLNESVLASDAYDELSTLLVALDRPADRRRAAAAALGWWGGWSSDQLATAAASDDSPESLELVEFQHQLVEWSSVLAEQGMPALYGRIRAHGDFLERMLRSGEGERRLTDLDHLVELVHAERRSGSGMTAASAAAALARLGSGAGSDESTADAVQRRVDSDADAVRIMTIHNAKGLEFPIVLLPSLSAGGSRVTASPPYTYYVEGEVSGESGHRVVDVACAGDQPEVQPTPEDRSLREQCGDQHRLTYVAMTRAAHLTVVWWAATAKQKGRVRTGLARLLFSEDVTASAETPVDLPDPGRESARLRELLAERSATNLVSVVDVGVPTGRVAAFEPDAPAAPGPPAEAQVLERNLPRVDRSWSYTGLARVVGHGDGAEPVAEDPDDETGADSGAADEVLAPVLVAGPEDAVVESERSSLGPEWDQRSPFEGLGAGADFGTMVHRVFEHVDFTSDTLAADLRDQIEADTSYRPPTDDAVDRLTAALDAAVSTPLGGAFGEISMSELGAAHRLDELRFELPLAPGRAFAAGRIAEVLARHLGGTPYGDWADRLVGRLGGRLLEGVLTGSIDLVLQRRTDAGPCYSVVDYKTNNLSPLGEDHLLRHYDTSDPRVVRRAMLDTNYALQAVVYTVVLHRYLRWRQPGYDPAVHLGPVGYFFVRGMVGESTPVDRDGGRSGVLSWQLPVDMIRELDELLSGGDPS